MQLKIGIYVRVSTEEQAQVADGSIDSQQHRINGFIEIKKLQDKNWGKVIDTYIDDGYSAKSTNRPQYQRMIRDLKNGLINLILVTDISRLSRNIADFCVLLKELEQYKGKFLSIKEQFDTSTPIGEMMVFNMVNLAQFERKQTSERISMNFHSRALRGLVNGGNPIIGYDKDPTNPGKLIVNESEAELVRTIFDLYCEGNSLSVVAEKLSLERAQRKAFGNRKFRHLTNGLWTIKAVQTILKNYAYIGIREINKVHKNEEQSELKGWQQYQLVKASWPPILTEQQFKVVQERLRYASQAERQRFDKGDRRIFLASGIMRCGECGRSLIGQSAHGNKKIHRYYGHKILIGEKVACAVKRYSADEVEAAIVDHLDKVITSNGYLQNIESAINANYWVDKKKAASQKLLIQKNISKLELEIDSIFKVLGQTKTGSLGSNLVHERLDKLAEKKNQLTAELQYVVQQENSASLTNGALKTIEKNILDLKKVWKKASPVLKKKLLKSVFSHLVLKCEQVLVYYSLAEGKGEKITINRKGPLDKLSGGPSFFSRANPGFYLSQSSPIVSIGGAGEN